MSLDARPNGVALVTGSRTGIGRYIAECLAGNGFIVVGCSRNPAGWEAANYCHILADVSDEHDVKRLITGIRKDFGRLDVVINNAGGASMNHSLTTPVSTLDRLIGVNLRGTFAVSRESAKIMQTRGFGRIVNLSSIAVPLHLEGESAYIASKSAIEGLTRVLARELAPFNITVNAVGPPPVATDLIRNVPAEKIASIIDRLAIKRLCTPADVFNVIDFLIRPESEYVTGQVIYLGGGV